MRTLTTGASALRSASAALRELYLSHGYEEALTPSFEPWDELRPALGRRALKDSIKFIDDGGAVAALRPEVTAGLVRRALREQRPGEIRRFFYIQKIFRRSVAGGQREFWQAGGEILGGAGPFYDAEAIELLGASLRLLGARDHTLEIGDGGLLIELVPDEALRGKFKGAFARHDGAAVAELAREAPETSRALLTEMPFLRGETPILATAARLHDRPLAALARLEKLAAALAVRGCVERVMFDLALPGWADYYDGPLVEAYADGVPGVAGAGGRYDGLTRRFGHPLPACGAALLVDPFLPALAEPARPQAILLVGDSPAAAMRAADLRAAGRTVVHLPALDARALAALRERFTLVDEGGAPC